MAIDTPTPAQQLEEVLAIADQRQRRADDAGQVSRAIAHLAPTLRRALAALEAVEWRPIETAPKDGRRILLSSKGQGVWMGHWEGGRINGWTRFNCIDIGWEPVLWMPLPAPPADAVEVSRG